MSFTLKARAHAQRPATGAHAYLATQPGDDPHGHVGMDRQSSDSLLAYTLACVLLLLSACGAVLGNASGAVSKLSSGSFALSGAQALRGIGTPIRVSPKLISERAAFSACQPQREDANSGNPGIALDPSHWATHAHASSHEELKADSSPPRPVRAFLRPFTRAPPVIT